MGRCGAFDYLTCARRAHESRAWSEHSDVTNKNTSPRTHWSTRLEALLPGAPAVSLREQLTGALAALAALGALTTIAATTLDPGTGTFMVASMGASAVLVYAVPHSPFSHPWAVGAGHVLAALSGVTCAQFVPNLSAAAALAVGITILLMHGARCLHPPGGATALIPVIGGESIRAAGFGFVIMPVLANVLVLLALAVVINNLIPGRRWPPRRLPQEALTRRFGLRREDLEKALADMGVVLDVDQGDLEKLFASAAMHANRRKLGAVRCADIMTRKIMSAEPGERIDVVWARMRQFGVKGMPVVDKEQRVIGMLTIIDFMKQAAAGPGERFLAWLRRFVRAGAGALSIEPVTVGEIMSAPAITAREDVHVVSLVPLFATHGIHHIPVVDQDGRLRGIVTQSDLVAVLYEV